MTSTHSPQQLNVIQEEQPKAIEQQQNQIGIGGIEKNSMNDPAQTSKFQPLAIESPLILKPEDEDTEVNDKNERTLFVGNLDKRVTEELLYEIFIQSGPLESVRIAKDNTGHQRTFGFILFTHPCTPPYAMRLMDGLTLFGRTVTIKFKGSRIPPPLKASIIGVGPSIENNQTVEDFTRHMDETPSTSRNRNRSRSSHRMRYHSNYRPYQRPQRSQRNSPNQRDRHPENRGSSLCANYP